jgi:hypothetical protein
MEIAFKARRSGSRGVSKFTLVVIALVVGGGIFMLSKFGPVYQQKWRFEDRMREDLGRMAALHNEGILGELAHYAEEKGIPIEPAKQCMIVGEEGKPGSITCNYEVLMDFPLMKEPYKLKLQAFGKRSHIPLTSN